MYISKIIIKKFRHLENEVIGPLNFNNKASDLVVFAGPNGSGKSSVLELIGYALSNSYSLSWQLSRTFDGFSFEVGIGLSSDEKRLVVESLNKDLQPEEKKLDETLNAIDLKENTTDEIKKSQKQQLKEDFKRRHKHILDIIDYLNNNNIYYRAFAFNDGEYAKNSTLHNQLHSHVTKQLKDLRKRSLGFFLRSDRNYPQKNFDRNKLFSYENITKKEHLWSMAFNTSEIQYLDMYEYLVQQKYHYLRELGGYHDQKNKGVTVGDEPRDPIKPYEELLNKLFPDYKFANKSESIPSNLYIKLPSEEVITFNDLSSGEKEVFFILSFFIRHNVENAIIVIDEPELHLHPELSRVLIRSVKSIRKGNQIWMATHNSEIIDEAGRDKVIYVARDLATRKSKFINGDNEQNIIAQLKNMFGFSGYIGVAKNLVFLEGDNSSSDRKFYSTLFPGNNSNFKLIPSNSSENLSRINAAILSIMEANLGWMNFYLIRDRDYLTSDMIEKYKSHSSGKVFVLSKHELENYLIDFQIISAVLSEIFNINKTEEQLKAIFYDAALSISSDVIRDMVSFRLNLELKPQDFSLGNVLKGQPYFELTSNECNVKEERSNVLKDKFNIISSGFRKTLNSALSNDSINKILLKCETEVKDSLESNHWLSLFPGKELIELVSKKLNINNIISFQNSIIKEFAANTDRIDSELSQIFVKINSE